jgi:phosphohistidine phosphatase
MLITRSTEIQYKIDAMTRELLILRHAKSAWNTDAPTDFERPLAKRGRKAAPRVGRWLLQQGLIPDYVVSSPAKRARQTVVTVCKQLEIGSEKLNWDQRIYGGGTASLLSVLRESPDNANRVLIAGHNPGLEMLLQYLCGSGVPFPRDGKLMPTAAVAHLQIPSDWENLARGEARLLSITRARSLTDF